MKFFIVALMAALPNSMAYNGEAFIFTSHEFKSIEMCQEFARQNMIPINMRLVKEFGPKRPPQLISCVNEETVKKMMDPENGFVDKAKEDLI